MWEKIFYKVCFLLGRVFLERINTFYFKRPFTYFDSKIRKHILFCLLHRKLKSRSLRNVLQNLSIFCQTKVYRFFTDSNDRVCDMFKISGSNPILYFSSSYGNKGISLLLGYKEKLTRNEIYKSIKLSNRPSLNYCQKLQRIMNTLHLIIARLWRVTRVGK